MKVYFISGLAADKRVFKNIEVPPAYEIVHLDWINPLPKETLSDYSIRLAEKINKEEPFVIVGLSMGGMIASEIARHFEPVQTILISSIPSANHLPAYFKWVSKVNLHKLVPVSLVKSAAIMKRGFTSESKEDKKILKQIIRESDPVFIKWAMHAILKWKSSELGATYIHIHGSKDEVLPMRYTKPTHKILKGGHLMVLNRSNEINSILQDVL